MTPAVFLVRGINVGGRNLLKMAALSALCADLGLSRVRTFLQSGNVVCDLPRADPDRLARGLEERIARTCGFAADVAVRTGRELSGILAANPLAGGRSIDPSFLHATFIVGPARHVPLDESDCPLAKGERAVAVGGTVYLYCPHGYGTTKINNAFFEKKLGVRATTRNWRTVTALEAMARGKPSGE